MDHSQKLHGDSQLDAHSRCQHQVVGIESLGTAGIGDIKDAEVLPQAGDGDADHRLDLSHDDARHGIEAGVEFGIGSENRAAIFQTVANNAPRHPGFFHLR